MRGETFQLSWKKKPVAGRRIALSDQSLDLNKPTMEYLFRGKVKSKGRKSLTELFRPVMGGAYRQSNGLFEKARTDTSRTRLHAFHRSRLAVYTPNLLKIWIPNLHTFVVRVAYFVTHHRFFATYLTDSRHINSPLRNATGH
jgi:hypothetical protein